ncbi:glycoside hydrolase family 16 protein [Acrodontium crateriforme]|uniref:Crh-like protein n=1 Tax=Acrodontium crateriforme TaxID=150365 RepID=A0AAQ3LYN3_9PEZI|nr:glycoside hydrolase family 16 protein [Acrodontium crateriforme]
MRFSSNTAAFLAAVLPLALAQTSTDCNPLEKTCPKDTGLNEGTLITDFTKGESKSWSTAAYTTINYDDQGANFVISKTGQAPTIQTDFYIFFGRVDIKMKCATGAGIVSSIVLESDDLDEIDFEFVTTWPSPVETNYFGKGNTTAYDRAIYYPASNPDTTFHTYSVDWTSERINWLVDGTVVRTLNYGDANGGKDFPQTPMRLKMGNWAAGAASEPEGTVEWAGGHVNWAEAPFTMVVASVDITNANPADSYEYSDETGSWQSIKVIKDGSNADPSGSVPASVTASANSTNTVGPTSSISVTAVMPTGAAVTTTSQGASYSMNNASVSAQNPSGSMTSSVVATTEVPGSNPTSSASSSSTKSNGASSLSVMVGGSLLSIALGALLI